MKNNYFKYGLIILVIIIWGKLIINYFGLFNNQESIDYSLNETVIPEVKKNDINYVLKLDYRDPFLNGKRIVRENRPSSKVRIKPTKKKNTPTKIVPAPIVEYKGIIENKKLSKKTGLVIIDGRSHLVSTQVKIGNVSILNFDITKLKYLYEGKEITVNK